MDINAEDWPIHEAPSTMRCSFCKEILYKLELGPISGFPRRIRFVHSSISEFLMNLDRPLDPCPNNAREWEMDWPTGTFITQVWPPQ